VNPRHQARDRRGEDRESRQPPSQDLPAASLAAVNPPRVWMDRSEDAARAQARDPSP
jgi:hypothetical protein